MICQFFDSYNVLPRKKILLLDRDGTLIEDCGKTNRIDELSWMTGALNCLSSAQLNKWSLAVVSNQRGLSENLYSLDQLFSFNKEMAVQATAHGVNIEFILMCPHPLLDSLPTCKCRKPGTLMLSTALNLFLGEASPQIAFVGNSLTDSIAAAQMSMPYWNIEDESDWENLQQIFGSTQ